MEIDSVLSILYRREHGRRARNQN